VRVQGGIGAGSLVADTADHAAIDALEGHFDAVDYAEKVKEAVNTAD